jgi:hypothetical protein
MATNQAFSFPVTPEEQEMLERAAQKLGFGGHTNAWVRGMALATAREVLGLGQGGGAPPVEADHTSESAALEEQD